jgi:hypothetical protein
MAKTKGSSKKQQKRGIDFKVSNNSFFLFPPFSKFHVL